MSKSSDYNGEEQNIEEIRQDFATAVSRVAVEKAGELERGTIVTSVEVPQGEEYEEVNWMVQCVLTVAVSDRIVTPDEIATEVDDGLIKLYNLDEVKVEEDRIMTDEDARELMESETWLSEVIDL
jgi:predicted AlkP superfamily phosphohydrolase/phosphomutase